MQKFHELPYERPDMAELKKEFNSILELFENSQNVNQQLICIQRLESIKSHFGTMQTIASIRHTIDTRDEFYDRETDFFDENTPLLEEKVNQFDQALVKSPFRAELEEKLGKQYFNLIDVQLKTFKPEIMPDLIEENKLSTEYSKLVASAEVEFEGQTYTLAQLTPFRQDQDRARRKAATAAYYGFYADNQDQLDRIYDDLVNVRTKIARTLGYENFIELAYYRLSRTDYNAADVAKYRNQVYTGVVPLVSKLKQRQQARLGMSELKHYDESLNFNTGNPLPQGDSDFIVDQAKTMYQELSPETDEFFNFMLDYELMDLLAKPGKEAGGYCTMIFDYKAPFIFANFNGTQGDIEVMTHEAGHAFQCFQSRDIFPLDMVFPTLEAAEIHSMSMEFLTWPWMHLFFEEQTDKFKFSHLSGSIEFIPYGVAVDEYQHWVYANPEATPAERNAMWREIEQKYQPHLDFDGDEFLENGGKWMRQLHIFGAPMYYIDYTLAQVCAFQFLLKSLADPENAWADYLRLCQTGGSKPFLELLEVANLENPFIAGSLAKVMPQLEEILDSFDDQNM